MNTYIMEKKAAYKKALNNCRPEIATDIHFYVIDLERSLSQSEAIIENLAPKGIELEDIIKRQYNNEQSLIEANRELCEKIKQIIDIFEQRIDYWGKSNLIFATAMQREVTALLTQIKELK